MVVAMSRGPLRSLTEICADCNAPDSKWASVNRGVLICDECCSIHRSLGRHISQVRSLKKGTWAPSRLACVHQLMSSGANNIWEHALVDPTLNKQCRRKPNPRDQLHPTKADFIRAKYQFLAFTKKYKDEEMGTVTDLSKQLHSSVRTNNLETSLRLLSLGADPNFLSPERGNRALHVAAQSGQSSQIELLVIYGADPGATDSNGKTPHDIALAESHTDIAHRLIECQYELTDTLAYYLCFRKPDHNGGQHFIIPEMADSVDLSELAKSARKKLQALPNHLFEELAMDVYDEVDRRENDSIWLSLNGPSTQLSSSTQLSDRQAVPFLPVNPDFSSTRNQGRQKLARFNAREFATLIIDILGEAKRRQQGLPSNSNALEQDKVLVSKSSVLMRKVKTSSYSDDEPAYDTVASDEDYSSVCDAASVKEKVLKTPESKVTNHVETSEAGDGLDTLQFSQSASDDSELRMALNDAQTKCSEMSLLNDDLQQEVLLLKNTVQQLMRENAELKQARSHIPVPTQSSPLHNGGSRVTLRSATGSRARPHSMVDTRQYSGITSSPITPGSITTTRALISAPKPAKPQKPGNQDMMESDNGSLYDNDDQSLEANQSFGSKIPSQGEISAKTETITKKIQELLFSAQKNNHKSYVPCATQISEAVNTMVDLFPQDLDDGKILSALTRLSAGAKHLCEAAHTPPAESNGMPDYRMKTQLIIQCAYDIAKGAKILVTTLANG